MKEKIFELLHKLLVIAIIIGIGALPATTNHQTPPTPLCKRGPRHTLPPPPLRLKQDLQQSRKKGRA
jgi:hypothetical protein